MKILFVATDYPEKGKPTTGFPNYLYRVSLALLQMGHEPMILASGKRTHYRKEQGICIWTIKIEYKDYKSQTFNYVINGLKKGYMLNKKAEEIIKEYSIDIIQYTSLEGIAVFFKNKIPAVLRLSSYAKIYFSSYQTYSPIAVHVMAFMERCSARKCNVVFAPCKITAQAFGRDCRRRVKVIETPFLNDVQEYDYIYVDKYLKNKKYVLFFGTLYAEKGILVISDIIKKFLQNNLEYYFVFVGEDCRINNEYSSDLLIRRAEKYKNRVIIWNALPHKQLYPIIKEADFVVLPSLMDNLPNACIEAMYFEKVVIGTNGASFEQLITHGKTGLLCKRGDSKDLLNKIQMAVYLSELQKKKIGKQAKERVDKLKPEIVVRKLLTLYNCLINNKKIFF